LILKNQTYLKMLKNQLNHLRLINQQIQLFLKNQTYLKMLKNQLNH
jgi:hypothetical protein